MRARFSRKAQYGGLAALLLIAGLWAIAGPGDAGAGPGRLPPGRLGLLAAAGAHAAASRSPAQPGRAGGNSVEHVLQICR